MSKLPLIVVDSRTQFRWQGIEGEVVTAEEFVADPPKLHRTVINLCRNYRYLGIGYYCSLLAEARGHEVFPNVKAMLRLRRGGVDLDADRDNETLNTALSQLPATTQSMSLPVYLGRTANKLFTGVAQAVFRLFKCPLMLVSLERRDGKWRLRDVKPLALREIPHDDDAVFTAAIIDYPARDEPRHEASSPRRLQLAVLHDATEVLAPSKRKTIDHMAEIGRDLGIDLTVIGKRDLNRLSQFDALFIRQTTSVENITFQFATKAEQLGLPVLDDPASIVHCGNKVFLVDLLPDHGVRIPKTRLVTHDAVASVAAETAYPIVVKSPDGCFSTGVKRADDAVQFQQICAQMLRRSRIILMQEFLYTTYDWRIGLLGGKPLFAVRYHMCKDHWQIIHHLPDGAHVEGRTESVPLESVPRAVLNAAISAGRLIGDGLYGIDLKETEAGVFVIEVNDNPNIDVGMEDGAQGDELYRILLEYFIARAGRPQPAALPRDRQVA